MSDVNMASLEDVVKDFCKTPLTGQIEKRVNDTQVMLNKVLANIYDDNTGLDLFISTCHQMIVITPF